ncbi:MAG: DNA polymerase III subunit delta [Clostridiales bacterium]|nr:DNA polymerase III subunit delta [Clostridiales bacterium]
MEFIDLKKQLKSQKPAPCYVCYGDDDFVLDRAMSLLTGLAAEPKPFNCIDREFISSRELTDELMQLPLIGDYRVVVARGKVDMSAVEKYLESPNPSAVLVLPIYTPHDSWGKAATPTIPKGGVGINCNRMPYNQVAPFVIALCNRTGATAEEKAIRLLYNKCGGYMSRIDAETQKLAMLKAGGQITESDVNEHVKPDTEFVVFELCESILNGDTARALSIVDGMAKNNDLVAAFTLIYNRFRKIFAVSVDPDGIEGLGVKPTQVGRLKTEGARYGKLRLKKVLDMLESADYSYKTGASTVYDALTSFVAQAAYIKN